MFESAFSGGGNSRHQPAKDSEDEEDKPVRAAKPNKRARQSGAGGAGDSSRGEGGSRANPGESAPGLAGLAGLAGLGFSQINLQKSSKKKCNESRELERSEALVLQAQQLLVSLGEPLVTRIPYARAETMKDKIQSRLSDELTGLYMESVRTNGPTSRAATVWDNLKTEFRNMERAADFLEALQDSEASPATLSQRARALEEVGVKLPQNISGVICRRAAEELMQAGDYDSVCKFLDVNCKKEFPQGICSIMPATDPSNPESAGQEIPAEVREFQCTCLVACMTQIFMTTSVPASVNDPEKVEVQKKEMLADKIKEIAAFLKVWQASSLQAELSQAKCLIVEDINKVSNLVNTVLQPSELDSATCEQLETAKSSLIKTKTGPFYAAVAMSPVGVEICSEVSHLIQQSRSDTLLALDIEAAFQIAQGLKTFDGDGLLKLKETGDWDVVISGSGKIMEMMTKFLNFKEKASKQLQARSQEGVQFINGKVDELYKALVSVIRIKYEKTFGDSFLPKMQAWAKGVLGDDGPVLYELLSQMSGFHPLAKVPIVKLLGKHSAEGLEQEMAIVKTYVTGLKDAFQKITKVLAGEINEDIISQPLIADFFVKLHDTASRKQLSSTAPFVDTALSDLARGMQVCLGKWLSHISSTFANFAGKLLKPEISEEMVHDALREEVLGVVEINAEDSAEAKQELDWFFVFNRYYKYMGVSRVAFCVDGENIEVHAAFLCVVGALLRIAKFVMVCANKVKESNEAKVYQDMLIQTLVATKDSPVAWKTKASMLLGCQPIFGKFAPVSKHFDEMLVAAVAITGEMNGVRAFYQILQKIMTGLSGQMIANIATDMGSLISGIRDFHKELLQAKDVEAIFKSDPLDKQAIQNLASDMNVQKLVLSGSRADRILSESAAFLNDLQLLTVNEWISEVSINLIGATSSDIKVFHAVGGTMAQDKQSGTATMATVRYINGSITLAQALTRNLQPGETRLGLVSRCQTILEKKGIFAESALSKKASALKGNK
ncbi:unnamed protein product [Symbiodinium sp. CCMP2592]|nr:unnamed protein product [Symbiodinium sp. CCMP2592]